MTDSLTKYRRNYINICEMSEVREARVITTYYKYNGNHSTFVFFVNDNHNIYVETPFGSIVIPFGSLTSLTSLANFTKLHVYYIISLQLTPIQSNIYYCDHGYNGLYKEMRNWYILTNICWKSQYMSFGDYCYFKENPYAIDLTQCDTEDTVKAFMNRFNELDDPYKICDWLINYETSLIERELYQNEEIINDEKNRYSLLQIVKDHYNLNEDIMLKIYQYMVFEEDNRI